jgi:ribosomal protein S18 acetylase RimI-like enzyme
MAVDEPAGVEDLLHRVGFRESYRLVQMGAMARARGAPLEMQRASGARERVRLAGFMVEQFFGRQGERFKRRVAETTAAAAELELYEVREGGSTIASVMISDHGDVLGVYNLCVSLKRRGEGWGSALVETLFHLGRERNLPLTLQCDARLEAWYRRLGFVVQGTVRVYSLARTEGPVIL